MTATMGAGTAKQLRGWLMLAMLAGLAVPTWAINKCTDASGKVVYQDTPCTAAATSQHINEAAKPYDPYAPKEYAALKFAPVTIDPSDANSAAQIDLIIAKANLKDPDSAKFTGLHVFRFEAQNKVFNVTCGLVNAKNSYGGYAGVHRFWVNNGLYTQTHDYIMPDVRGDFTAGKWQDACFKDGTAVAQ